MPWKFNCHGKVREFYIRLKAGTLYKHKTSVLNCCRKTYRSLEPTKQQHLQLKNAKSQKLHFIEWPLEATKASFGLSS